MHILENMRKNWYRYLIWLFWIIFVVLSLFANTPDNYNLDFKTKKLFTYIFPQGWGFFTKDPREPIVDAFEIDGPNLKLLSINNFTANNFYGLSRDNRRVGYEISQILNSLAKEKWQKSEGIYAHQIPDSLHTISVDSKLLSFKTGQEYIFHQYRPVPFAWANTDQINNRPYSIIRFKIENYD